MNAITKEKIQDINATLKFKPSKKQIVVEEEKISTRRKRQREEQKQQKRQAAMEFEKAAKDIYLEEKLQDRVAFNDVVQEPPRISALPKARFRTPATLPTSVSSKQQEARQNIDDLKRKHQQRRLGHSAATRIALEEERNRAIASYRAVKQRKQMAVLAMQPS